jgi:serine/threonine protein kinase/tetratricopeptide (TPR) repeat protein
MSLLNHHDSPDSLLDDSKMRPLGPGSGASFKENLGGKLMGRYKLLRLLGTGGTGEVWLVEDTRLGRRDALKLLPAHLAGSPALARRLIHEARAASALNHPNIITIFEADEYADPPYIASEFIDGVSLRQKLAQGPLSFSETIDIAAQIATGLAVAHRAGLIHRDIKPENIMVRSDGLVKILDFGIARRFITSGKETPFSTLTEPGTIIGTIAYLSPEQARGQQVDPRTDIWSLGIVMYEMLADDRPFIGDSAADVIANILNAEPDLEFKRSIPAELQPVIAQALRKECSNRYESANQLLLDLRRIGLSIVASGAVQLSSIEDEEQTERIIPRTIPPALVGASSRRWFSEGGQRVRRLYKTLAPRFTFIYSATLLLSALLGGFLFWHSRQENQLTKKDTIVVADFVNTTGETVFDGTLKQALTIQLEQSPFLNVLSDQSVAAMLNLMDQQAGTRLTREIGREICLRSNSAVQVIGSIGSVGSTYLIGLQALNCQTGDTLASADAQASNRDTVLKRLQEVGNQVRHKLGETLASVEKFDKPLEQATTSSLKALKAFTEGRRVKYLKGDFDAIPYLERAIELDTNFALAYVSLATSYANTNQTRLASGYFKKAFELRNRVSERERFLIEGAYYDNVVGEQHRAIKIYAEWAQTYIADATAHDYLGFAYATVGQHRNAIPEAREAIRLNPDRAVTYANLVEYYLAVNQLDEAKAFYEQAQARKLDSFALRRVRYALGFLDRDEAVMREQVAWAMTKPGIEDMFLSMQSDTEAYYGHMATARKLSVRAIDSAKLADSREAAASWQVNAALREAEFGNIAEAQRDTYEALHLSTEIEPVAALALAYAGDAVHAQKIVGKIKKQFSLNTLLKFYYLPTIQAALELNAGNVQNAIDLLQPASAYELSEPEMFPVYFRGLAYLKAKQAQEAAAQFSKILAHRGLTQNSPIGALARVQLARSLAMSGNPAGARKNYQDFIALWSHADPDIPVLKHAKAEYAAIR